MENKNLDEIKKRNTKSKQGLLLLKRILSPNEYRDIAGLPVVGSDNSTTGLVVQLETNRNPENELWWATLQDMGYLLTHTVEDSIKVAIVADEESAIVCELPDDYDKLPFVVEWRTGE